MHDDAQPSSLAPGAGPKPPARTIVVDDFPDIAGVLCTLLSIEGYACRLATSGEQALAYCEVEQFDVMLLDYQLGGITGLDVAQALSRHPHRPLWIIVISAQGRPLFEEALARGEIDDYLMKPADCEEVLSRVALGLGKKLSLRQ